MPIDISESEVQAAISELDKFIGQVFGLSQGKVALAGRTWMQ